MKNLTVKPVLNDGQFLFLERFYGKSFPPELKSFLKEYAGKEVIENKFQGVSKVYTLSTICSYRMIYDFLKVFKDEGFKNCWIPFALDVGGWVYSLKNNGGISGKIFLYQSEGSFEDENQAFEFVANSFEEFIDGLQSG